MSVTNLVTPLKRQTLSADVYGQFKELLISGRMMPGEQISLRNMAQALGVSVMPVREAVQRLAAEQALELSPNRTLRVPMMSVSQFREITGIRMNLEGMATAAAATAMGDTEIQQVLLWHERFTHEMAKKQPDGSRLISFNKELHFAIYRGARMPVLLQLIEALWLRIGPILNYDLRSGPTRVGERVALSHHASLVQAMQNRDSEAARQAVQADISSAAEFIISVGALLAADQPSQPRPGADRPGRV
jgi:DNA-binding GntR family transcriptional regulator